jgi:hypothetical protein
MVKHPPADLTEDKMTGKNGCKNQWCPNQVKDDQKTLSM